MAEVRGDSGRPQDGPLGAAVEGLARQRGTQPYGPRDDEREDRHGG